MSGVILLIRDFIGVGYKWICVHANLDEIYANRHRDLYFLYAVLFGVTGWHYLGLWMSFSVSTTTTRSSHMVVPRLWTPPPPAFPLDMLA